MVGSAWITIDRSPAAGTKGTVVLERALPRRLTSKSSQTSVSSLTRPVVTPGERLHVVVAGPAAAPSPATQGPVCRWAPNRWPAAAVLHVADLEVEEGSTAGRP